MKRFGPFKPPEAGLPPSKDVGTDYSELGRQTAERIRPSVAHAGPWVGSTAISGEQVYTRELHRPEGALAPDKDTVGGSDWGFVVNPEYAAAHGIPKGSVGNHAALAHEPTPQALAETFHVPLEHV